MEKMYFNPEKMRFVTIEKISECCVCFVSIQKEELILKPPVIFPKPGVNFSDFFEKFPTNGFLQECSEAKLILEIAALSRSSRHQEKYLQTS